MQRKNCGECGTPGFLAISPETQGHQVYMATACGSGTGSRKLTGSAGKTRYNSCWCYFQLPKSL